MNAIAATKVKILLTKMWNLGFIGQAQYSVLTKGVGGTEGAWYREKIVEIWSIIEKMPKTYESKDRTAHLHYFAPSMDWYIIEKDVTPDGEICEQIQAYGVADFHRGDGRELGYISLEEIVKNGAELDLHFEPKVI